MREMDIIINSEGYPMKAASKVRAIALEHPLLQIVCQGLLFAGLSVMILFLGGCSKRYNDLPPFLPFNVSTEKDNASVGRFKTSYLAEQIDGYYRGVNPGPLGVTTFVNLDDLHNTSSFGRMLSEQMMSELVMRGFDVVELRHADALQFLESTGEFALSRDISSIRHERQLGGVVVGTYVVSPVRIYVNSRLVDPTSSMILSAGSVEMSKTSEIAKLLRTGGMTGTLERIPVRHLATSTVPMMGMPTSPMGRVWQMEEQDTVSNTAPRIEPQLAEPKVEAKPTKKK